ncbi:hypothetical protein [Nonomuraea sp. NPDC050310]
MAGSRGPVVGLGLAVLLFAGAIVTLVLTALPSPDRPPLPTPAATSERR